ncbi:transglutaminase-like domain-containing protein [Actinoplanes utahensis]|uniref:Transglutaminase n=1 Tax=Actinoplanes utahensis TaxID=1869 RepID=A0A0A6UKD0_ACTUT|nr:transglutaminase-like domain-containing protein [Actinoplanes utahensis]KHD75891.1 transglutaminase [Actinoplanes utahensis]GIF34976.1 hypothetical protein Aut01nite_79620 [Actinoplanes utahensis]
MDYTRQTRFSDPGRHLSRLTALPADVAALPAEVAAIGAVVRNTVVHYRASGIDFPPRRLTEIDSRWVETMLDALPPGEPLGAPRPPEDRIVGCCRDFTLLTVAALRANGIPARSRVGFADYFHEGFHTDHVVVEYHDGTRWVATDAQLDPAAGFPVDVADVPLGPGGLRTAAQSWRAFRLGDDDPSTYGVDPALPIRGPLMIGQYVLTELAHRRGDELLLWDFWGEPARVLAGLGGRSVEEAWATLPPWESGDVALLDEIAALLIDADAGDQAAERKLAERYSSDPRVRPGDVVTCHSPRGISYDVDLRERR